NFSAALAQMGSSGPRELPDAWGRTLAGLGEAALLDGHRGQAAQWLAQLTDFNRASKAAPASRGVADAARLDARLRQARSGTGRAAAASSRESCSGPAPAAAAVDSSSTPCHDAPLMVAEQAIAGTGAKH